MKTVFTILAFVFTCSILTGQNRPFPQHVTYTAGHIKPTNFTQSQLDGHVTAFYDQWKAAYLSSDCDTNEFYIEFAPNQNVSEGIGYGMMATAFLAGHDPDAQTIFDKLYNFYKSHPSNINPALMAWKQDNCISVGGVNSATDGDIDIAYGLLLAHEQWGSNGTVNYFSEAETMINAIIADDVNPITWSVKLGDWATSGSPNFYYATRGSDFILDHFRAFECATGDTDWTNVINTCFTLLDDMQTNYSAATGLIPDFIVDLDSDPRPADGFFLEGTYDGDYYYNACRVPWRIGTDYLLFGDTSSKATVDKITNWLKTATSNDVSDISNGYLLDGTKIFSFNDPAYTGAFAVAAMASPDHQTWLNDLYASVHNHPFGSSGYYENSLKLMYSIVLSCNYWTPICSPTLTAAFTADPVIGPAPLTVNFDASTSVDPLAGGLTYDWDFGESTSGTGMTPSHTFSNFGTFTVILTVTDTSNQTANTTLDIVVTDPGQPNVNITSPSDGATFTMPISNISFEAEATDPDGTIASVIFLINGDTLTATNSMGDLYEADWSPTSTGTYTLIARATDDEGKMASTNVSFTINPASNITVIFNVTNDWGNGYCSDVTIKNNGTSAINGWTLNFGLPAAIYDFWNVTWSNDGNNNYTASDISWNGTIPIGDSITVGFCANYSGNLVPPDSVLLNGSPVLLEHNGFTASPPSISISSPANNASFTLGDSIALEAIATDSDGTITSVVFEVDSNTIGATNTSGDTYAATWLPANAGTFVLKAIATDDDGLATETTILLTINNNCPAELTLSDSPILSGTYQAADSILATGVLGAGTEVYLKAGTAIDLGALFEVVLGSVLEVIIETCNN